MSHRSDSVPSASLTTGRTYKITGLVLFVIAALFCAESLKLRYYTLLGPGPGFFPLWIALGLAVLSLVIVVQATVGRLDVPAEDRSVPLSGALRILGVVGAMAAVTVLLEPLGFRLTMTAFLLILLLALGRQAFWLASGISLAITLGTFQLFTQLLKIPLPSGLLGF